MSQLFTHIPSRRFAGLMVQTSKQLELNAKTAQIPNLWQRFFSEDINSEINSDISDSLYGVYYNYHEAYRGSYRLLAGVEVSAQHPQLANGLTLATAPTAGYLRFQASGELPQAAFDCWQLINDYFRQTSEYQRCYSVDIETYALDALDIYIAVKTPN